MHAGKKPLTNNNKHNFPNKINHLCYNPCIYKDQILLILKDPFDALWQDKDAFNEVSNIQGLVTRALETRETLRFEVDGKGYYLKLHNGTTWREVFKNLLCFRLPVLGADQEWNAIRRLKKLGVDSLEGVAFGQKGINPINRKSFIITKDLAPVIDLHQYSKDWKENPPNFEIKLMILRRVATMVRKMHLGGINHRDCYLYHFLLHLPFDGTEETLKLSVIDLHRSQIRKQVPLRWRDKDLIGLYFSSMDIGLTQRDIFRFMKIYFNKPLHQIFADEPKLLRIAERKALHIKKRSARKGYE